MRKINVLQFICPTGFYGAERWVLALNNNLDPEKVRSYLAVTKDADSQLEIVKQFKSDEGGAFEIVASSRFSLYALRSLCKLIKDTKIDVIHTHGYKSDILGVIAAKLTGIKIISTPHGFGEHDDLKLKAYIFMGKFGLRFFDRVVPLSQQLVDEVLSAGIAKDKVTFIRNAVDLGEIEPFRLKKTKKEKTATLTIGYVGQIIQRKKVDHILDIFNKIWLENKNTRLLLLGDGNDREKMEAYANTLPSAEAVQFMGFRNDRLELLSQFDLFVMTSSDEGIPRCLMEAIAMGIPVAAYNISGIDQLVKHKETGLLADYGDKDTLKNYWQRLLSDKIYAHELTEKGRQFVNDTYSGQRMANEYTALYQTLLSDDFEG